VRCATGPHSPARGRVSPARGLVSPARGLVSPARRERPLLRDYEIHVEWLHIDAFRPGLVALREILSDDERERAERFGFAADREVFTITRATLRALLGCYLGLKPRQVELVSGPNGKPTLAGIDPALRFNVSHSGGIAMLALTRGRRVGIDVEEIQPDFPYREVAPRVFTPRERAALDALPADRQAATFFYAWTCKEAYVKARGTGLFLDPEAFSVSLPPAEPALLDVAEDPAEASRWELATLVPLEGFTAAVAAEGGDWFLKCRQLIPDPRDPSRIP
jgi:4'-phosphopantetheinyl transferase